MTEPPATFLEQDGLRRPRLLIARSTGSGPRVALDSSRVHLWAARTHPGHDDHTCPEEESTTAVRVLAPRSDDWSWQLQGRCRGYPSEVFFPESDDRQSRRGREATAKKICDGCAVVAPCRDHALNTPELHGVWGAMTSLERARLLSHSVAANADRRHGAREEA